MHIYDMLKWQINYSFKKPSHKNKTNPTGIEPKRGRSKNLISEHLGRLRAALLLCSFFSFKVGNREPSTIWETHILDADEFPTFFAQAVQVILNVFHHGLAASFKAV